MSELWTYEFDDAAELDLIPKAHHWNQLQTPRPAYGEDFPDYNGWHILSSNRGQANSDLETTVRLERYPGTPDYSFEIDVVWPSDGNSRPIDLWIRMTDDQNGYFARWDNNFSDGEVSLYRVVAGVETEIASVVSFWYTAGVAVTLKVVASGNRISSEVNGSEKVFKVEDAADLIYGNERIGFRQENGTSLAPTIAALVVEDETDPSGKTGDLRLFVDEDVFGAAELLAGNVTIDDAGLSYFGPTDLSWHEVALHSNPTWRPEQRVRLEALISGTYETIFRGRIRHRSLLGEVGAERVEYFAVGPRALSKYVVTAHPTSKIPTISWNASQADEDYDADFAGKELGEILAWYFDTYAEELRFHGAIDPDPDTTPYVQADLDAIAFEPTRLDLGGDFEAVILTILAKAPNIALIVDPDTWKWRFVDHTTLASLTLSYTSGDPIPLNNILDDATGIYTAIRVRSAKREKVQREFKTSDGGLSPRWGRELEEAWTPGKVNRSKITAVLESVVDDGTGDDRPILRLTKSVLFPDEAAGSVLTLDGDGAGTYPVIGNSYDTVTISKSGGFTEPNVPDADDAITIEDKRSNSEATENNGFSKVHREFLVGLDGGQTLAKDPCAKVWADQKQIGFEDETKKVPHQMTYGASEGVIVVGMPIVIPREEEGGCENSKGYEKAEATASLFVWEETVREYRWPAVGWRGDAYSTDAAKWGGGGDPGPDDWGIRREFLVEEPNWTSDAQNSEIETAAKAALTAINSKPYSGSVDIGGLEWDLRVLQKSLRFTTASALRSSTTGFEAANIVPFQVRYDFVRRRTSVTYGNAGEFARRFSDLRRQLAQKTKLTGLMKRVLAVEGFVQCVQQNQDPKTAAPSDEPICATRVRGDWGNKPGGGGGGGGADDPPPNLKGLLEAMIDKLVDLQFDHNQQKDKEPAPPPSEPAPPGENDPPSTPEGGGGVTAPPLGPVHQMADGTFVAPRPGSNAREELVELEADAGDASRPAWGPDQFFKIVGPIQLGRLYATFHHQHERDTETASWDGVEDTLILTKRPMPGTVSVKLRTPPLGNADYYEAAGGTTIAGTPTTIPYDTQREDPESIVSLGGGVFTVNAEKGGRYLVRADVSVEGSAASHSDAKFYLNGAPVAGSEFHAVTSPNAHGSMTGAAILVLAAADTVEVKAVHQTGGGTVSTVAEGSRIEFIEIDRPGAGVLVEQVEGGAEDYEVDEATAEVVLAVPPPTDSLLQVDYQSQGEGLTRSETIPVEFGSSLAPTETLLVEFIS